MRKNLTAQASPSAAAWSTVRGPHKALMTNWPGKVDQDAIFASSRHTEPRELVPAGYFGLEE